MKTRTILWQSLIALVPVVYYLIIWNSLPNVIPMHYDIHNKVNGWGSKMEMLGAVLLLFVITVGTSALVMNLDKLDPKKKYQGATGIIIKISWAVTVFVTALSVFIIYDTQQYVRTNSPANILSPKYMLAFISLLFVVLGNFMNSIKPNYFVGIRTPWNLEDEDNWRKTHHLGSKLWFFGGLIMIPLILLLPEEASVFVFMGTIIPITLIPFIYSFILFRRKRNSA